jgi:hypothetical protein
VILQATLKHTVVIEDGEEAYEFEDVLVVAFFGTDYVKNANALIIDSTGKATTVPVSSLNFKGEYEREYESNTARPSGAV